MADELGALRRTHYSDQLPDGKVTVMGWVLTVRRHGNITFATIRDKNGEISIVAKKGECPDSVRKEISALRAHSSVAITGQARRSPKAPSGVEVAASELRVFSEASEVPPFDPMAKTVRNIETRLEVRCIDLRRNALQAIFQARSRVLKAVRSRLAGEGFVEISTPKIISSATEGGAALFPIFYYDKQAFLAQSPQLYKEQLTMSFEKVFEIGPIFRAEPSRTNRHLAEAISIDIEEAFVDYNDIMDRAEGILRTAHREVLEYAESIRGGALLVPKVPDSIPRYSYKDLVERMAGHGIRTEWGDDLYPSNLKKIGLEGFYFIKDWPMGPKPFYVKPSDADPQVSESFDLMYGDLELSSGSTRVQKRSDLIRRLKNRRMDPDQFAYHLSAFDYGMPPHAGCGMGLERMMMALTGTENIRDATFYPRDVDRLTP